MQGHLIDQNFVKKKKVFQYNSYNYQLEVKATKILKYEKD